MWKVMHSGAKNLNFIYTWIGLNQEMTDQERDSEVAVDNLRKMSTIFSCSEKGKFQVREY